MAADEKTKVIPQSAINTAVKGTVRVPFGGLSADAASPQKKRILPGLLATGGLLAGGLLLTSFQTAGDSKESTPENAASTPAVITTSHPVSELVADDLSLEEARELAREEVGPRGLFTHKGIIHVTSTQDEMDRMTPQEKETFMKDVVAENNHTGGTETDVHGKVMNLEFPLMDKYLEVLTDEDGHAYTRDVNGNVNLLDNVTKDPFTDQLIRTDAETGEITQFNPTAILQNVDEGRIDVSIYPTDVEITNTGEILLPGGGAAESIVSTACVIDDSGIWDYDFDDDFFAAATPKSDAELLDERIAQIADEAGIDDIKKIKVNETDDGWNVKIKGDDGEKVKMHVSREDLDGTGDSEDGIGGIDNIKKIKIQESGDGWDVKIKGENGEKIKMHLTDEEMGEIAASDSSDYDNTGASPDSHGDATQDSSDFEQQS